jgi:hypothetical protein
MVQKEGVCIEKEQQHACVDIKLEFFFLFKN